MTDKGNSSKMSIMRIVQVLLKDSSKNHPLTQQEILDRMEAEYGMVVSRKSVGRNLLRLREAGFPVMCREVPRVVNGKDAPLSLDWYWDHALSAEDLQTLIDLLYFSHLPAGRVKTLAETLKGFYNRGFRAGKEFVKNIPTAARPCPGGALSILSEAMEEKKQITFYYDRCGVDGKWYHRKAPAGTDILYRGSPVRVAASDGRYVLLLELAGKGELSAFYVDRMSGIDILDDGAENRAGKGTDFLLPMETLYAGTPEVCTFEADNDLMTDVVEDFGKAAVVKSAGPSRITVEVTIQPAALKAWALAHAPHVRVTAPAPLVKEMREAGAALAHLYGV